MIALEIKGRARELIDSCEVFVLATVDAENHPHSRWMAAKLVEDGMTIYMETNVNARKVQEIGENPNIELLFASKDYTEVLRLSGRAVMDGTPEMRKRIWDQNPESAKYFLSHDDSQLGIIKFEPERLSYCGPSTGTKFIEVEL